MAIKYLRSTDGSNTDDGSTWALSKATMTGAGSAMAAGDTLYVSQAHAETQAAVMTIALPGTVAEPNFVIGSNDAAEPPTAGSEAATISTSGGNALNVNGSAFFEGLTFSAGDAANYANLTINGGTASSYRQVHRKCKFRLVGTHPSNILAFGSGNGNTNCDTLLIDSTYKLSNASSVINLRGDVKIVGGSLEAGTAALTAIFKIGATSQPAYVFIDGFDASSMSSTVKMFSAAAQQNGVAVACGCKMPTGWVADNIAGDVGSYVFSRFEMYDTLPAGGSRIPFVVKDAGGLITPESTIVMSGGSEVGSAKMGASALCTETGQTLELFPLSTKIASSGSAMIATVEFVHDSATPLTNADIYVDLYYPTATGEAVATTRRATFFSAVSDCPSSSAAWTTTGLASPLKQKITVGFTPGAIGLVRAVVRLGKASKTVYVDTKLTVA